MYLPLLIFCACAHAYYLTPIQKQHVKNILQNGDDLVMKQKVKRLLVSKYSLWAINKARYFQKKYKNIRECTASRCILVRKVYFF